MNNKKFYHCYSPEMRDFLNSRGLGLGVESDTVWKREDRIKFLKSKSMDFDESMIQDVPRKKWTYVMSTELSSALTEWSSRRPKNK